MEKNKTLLIMAAGMGSRFGGLKQIEPVGPTGEFIIDYSIYDALKAGFTKVVFIIKEENFELFKETVGKTAAHTKLLNLAMNTATSANSQEHLPALPALMKYSAKRLPTSIILRSEDLTNNGFYCSTFNN